MMLLPSDKELELLQKLKKCNDDSEREVILSQLKAIAIEEDAQYSNCPFEH